MSVPAKLEARQATFIIVQVAGQRFRIDFVQKREFNLLKDAAGVLAHYTAHPLLLNYNDGHRTTYICSPAADPKAVLNDIKSGVIEVVQQWRDWRSYFFLVEPEDAVSLTFQNLASGSGILSEAPISVTNQIVAACANHNVLLTVFGTSNPTPKYSLLFLDTSYVIAQSFRVRLLD